MKKAIIIEDQADSYLILEAYLQQLGIEVVGHLSKLEGLLELVQKSAPDLICLDLYLGEEETGVHIAEELRVQGVEVPFLFVTSMSDDWITENLLQKVPSLDPCSCVHKPVHPRELKLRLASLGYVEQEVSEVS